MEILITGNLSSLAGTLAEKLSHEKHKVILASCDAKEENFANKDIVVHQIDPIDELFEQLLGSYRFDAIIYIAPHEEQFFINKDISPGKYLDGLRNSLEFSKKEKVKRFFYISSTEVYGDSKDTSEETEPLPNSLNGFSLLAGEQFCKTYHQRYGLNASILRIPFIYGSKEKNTLLYTLLKSGLDKKQISFPMAKDTSINLIHADDIAVFIQRALDEEYEPDDLVINLASSNQFTCSELQTLLTPYFPKTDFSFDKSKPVFTRLVKISRAKKNFDWIAEYDLKSELPHLIEEIPNQPVQKRKPLEKLKNEFKPQNKFIKWIELFVGAGLMHFLNNLTGTLIQFKFIDFRLLFVVLMGSVHGLSFGLLAAFLASLSILYSWYTTGLDWALLIYNVDNWLPIAMYITAGAITGYVKDKKENELTFQNQQCELVHEKYDFLYKIYQEITKTKDQFREQLLGYRDSYGRIFEITQDLDTYQAEDVFQKALNILEQFLGNEAIALYTLDGKSKFARLSVSSRSMQNKIEKSLNLADFPKIASTIKDRQIVQNTDMIAKYPAYLAPIFNDGSAIALVVIWEASFDQFSMNYFNLFKVICGLIQASLVRSVIMLDAKRDKTFILSTNILQPEPFKEILRIKVQMRNNRIADFHLLKIALNKKDWSTCYPKIQQGIRKIDYVGTLENGNCYILLSQAASSNIEIVRERLSKLGFESELAEESEILYD